MADQSVQEMLEELREFDTPSITNVQQVVTLGAFAATASGIPLTFVG